MTPVSLVSYSRRMLARAAVVAMLTFAVASAAPETMPVDAAIAELLVAYHRDPKTHRMALIETLRPRRDDLPPGVSLVLADALVGAGRLRDATRILGDVLAKAPDAATASLAHLGLGWMALAADDTGKATVEFEAAADGPHALLAVATLGLIAASEGRGDDAVSLLNSIVYAAGTPRPLAAVARLGMGYAYYWTSDFRQAASTFDEVPRFHADSPLADDGAYGAAWARYRSGDVDGARESLEALAGDRSASAGVAASLLDLGPRAVFRTGVRAYEGHGSTPEEKLVAVLDRDGRMLAAAALARLDAGVVATPASDRSAIASSPTEVPAAPARPAVVPHTRPTPAARQDSSRWWIVGLAVAALLVVIARARRRSSTLTG